MQLPGSGAREIRGFLIKTLCRFGRRHGCDLVLLPVIIPVMSAVSIGNPIETGIRRNINFSIGFPIENELTSGSQSRCFPTLEFHNFLMNKYFLGWSKITIPLSDVI